MNSERLKIVSLLNNRLYHKSFHFLNKYSIPIVGWRTQNKFITTFNNNIRWQNIGNYALCFFNDFNDFFTIFI
jgi:hypothetical protein